MPIDELTCSSRERIAEDAKAKPDNASGNVSYGRISGVP